jgi:hypothetical protein
LQPISSNCGIALEEFVGDKDMNQLTFPCGALLRNIQVKNHEWAIGDHRGDKQKHFRSDHVRLLTREELAFVNKQVIKIIGTASLPLTDVCPSFGGMTRCTSLSPCQ